MSWRDAPLYVEAHDLARDVVDRASGWTVHPALASASTTAAADILTAVALALTFPESRALDLVAADRAIVRLRCFLRLASDLGLLRPGAARELHGRLLVIGRMVGGWRKRVPLDHSTGAGPPLATGA